MKRRCGLPSVHGQIADGLFINAIVFHKYEKHVFLAHLSRRLIGELIVYKGIRRPSVRPSTFSNDISSEAEKPILFIFHI